MSAKKYLTGLRGKLLIAGLGLALIPPGIATLFTLWQVRKGMEEGVGRDRSQAAVQIAGAVDRLLFDRMMEVKSIGTNTELVGAALGLGDAEATRKVLYGLLAQGHLARNAAVYDASGQLMGEASVTGMAEAPASVAGEPWFGAAMEADAPTFVGAPVRDAMGNLTVRLADGVRSMNGEKFGTITVELDWTQVGDVAFAESEKGYQAQGQSTVHVYVVSLGGDVLAAVNEAEVGSLSFSGSHAAAEIQAGHKGYGIETLNGRKTLAAWAPMSYAERDGYGRFMSGNAGVIVVQDAAEAFAGITMLRNLLLILAAVAGGLVVLVAVFMTGRISKPVVEATLAAERLAIGDTEFAMPERAGDDELARLSASLGKLAQFMRDLTHAAEKVAATGTCTSRSNPRAMRTSCRGRSSRWRRSSRGSRRS